MKVVFSKVKIPNIALLHYLLAFLMVDYSSKECLADDSPQGASQSFDRSIRSTADLQRLLRAGMGTNEIVALFGEPSWSENVSKTRQRWHYSLPAFPADDAMRGCYVIGVVVGITNGDLEAWGCIYLDAPKDDVARKQSILPLGNAQAPLPKLQLFVVSTDPIAGGRFIDTERLPKVGYISSTPTLAIGSVKEVTLEERMPSENQSRTNWTFSIFLAQEDAARLKSVSTAKISKRLLIMIDNEPVWAPIIMGSLGTGSFAIECHDRLLMERIKELLARMAR